MGEITKATQAVGAPLTVPEEGPVISRDEVVTTTTSSTTVTTVTKTRAEVNDATTGKQITRDTTTTVEKVERNTPTGVILMETKTSESWVKANEGTLHFIESESTTTHSRPGSAGAGSAPQDNQQLDGHHNQQGRQPDPINQPDWASATREPGNPTDQKSVVKDDDTSTPLANPENQQPPPYCEPQRKSNVPRNSRIFTSEPPQ